MAGRRKMMAAKVGTLEERTVALAGDMFLTIPAQYREHPNAADALNTMWNCALQATLLASMAMEELADLLRKRAGIRAEPEPEPATGTEEQRAEPGGEHEPVADAGAGD